MPPAIIAAGIGAAGAIGGGLIASSGAKSAAKAQTTADQQAIAQQQRQYDQTRSDFAPYREAGTNALNPLESLLGLNGNDAAGSSIAALQQSPLYQSLYNNGQETLLQNGSATGGLRGGNMQTGLADFGRDTLAQVIQSQIGNLGGLVSLGEGATNQGAQFGQQAANNISSLNVAQGNALAGSAAARAGIWSGVVNNVAGLASSQQSGVPSFLSKLF